MEIVVYADDLTGANDTAVAFLGVGPPHTLLFEQGRPLALPEGASVVAVDVHTRGLGAEEAYRRMFEAASAVRETRAFDKAGIVYKKMDSVLRGTFGAECDAVMEAHGAELCIVAPAYPRMGRTTEGGVQLVNGEPVQHTEAARDPLTPVQDGRVAARLSAESRYLVGEIGLEALTSDERFTGELERLRAGGCRLVACDAATDADLDRIVSSASRLGLRIIWAGSAGLAQALALAMAPRELSRAERFGASVPAAGRALIVSGSRTEVNARQFATLVSLEKSVLLEEIPAEGLLRDGPLPFARAADAIRILPTGCGKSLPDEAGKYGIEPADIHKRLLDRFAKLVRHAVETGNDIGLLAIVGGETARHVLDELGVARIELMEEPFPGIIAGFVCVPGIRSPLCVVTKSGGFGNDRTLFEIREWWRRLTNGVRDNGD